MSWMPWPWPITHRIAPEFLLKKRGEGVVFSHKSHQLSEGLWALLGFHEDALVFLGLSETQSGLEDVLEDAKARPQWRKALWSPLQTLPDFDTLELWGTPFQIKIWQALLEIPEGETRTYGDVADAIGSPEAARAVGTAIGANTISGFIPCHRVIPKNSQHVGNYRWGSHIKQRVLDLEVCGG